VKERISKLVILAGVKTTDGETGSVGPQVAEGVSELLGTVVPHATYVEDFDIDTQAATVTSRRMIGYLSQKLEMRLPALMTVSEEYRPGESLASGQLEVRANNYRGKIFQAVKWTADDLGADIKRLGLAGSPTIVGTGIDVGKQPVQKIVGKSLVFAKPVGALEFESKKYGPFSPGELSLGLPDTLVEKLKAEGALGVFSLDMLAGELFA
jgi:electron transfer flavoprotein beta subunit